MHENTLYLVTPISVANAIIQQFINELGMCVYLNNQLLVAGVIGTDAQVEA